MALKLADFEYIPADSAIYVPGKNIESILFGIDAGVPELLLAKQLGLDAVISHHPKGGTAVVNFHYVFKRHIQQMIDAGVPKSDAETAVQKKMTDLQVEMHTRNFGHAVDVAKILKMPYLNIHTPLDELGRRILSEKIAETAEDSTIEDVISTLSKLPEFRKSDTKIETRLGDSTNKAGNIVVSHGAGTNGGYRIAKTYFEHGIQTLVYIHISPGDLEKLKSDGVGNLLITGHIASDSVGINPFISELENNDVSVSRIGIIPP